MLLLAGPAAAHRVHPAISILHFFLITISGSQSHTNLPSTLCSSGTTIPASLSGARCLDDCQYVSMQHRLLQEQVPALKLPTKCRKFFTQESMRG